MDSYEAQVIRHFSLRGDAVSCRRYGRGHINVTYLVETSAQNRYILQKNNHHVFRDVPALMENISAVSAHLRSPAAPGQRVLNLIPTAEGEPYFQHADGSYWRVYDFVENRAKAVQKEIEFALARENEAGTLVRHVQEEDVSKS